MMIKRKRVSKRNKTAWRKHTDIKDVEDFLEDQRLEERLGTPFVTKADSELFTLDTKPSCEDDVPQGPILTAKQRKRLLMSAQPKCFQALENVSKVQDPNKKRNTLRPVGSRPRALSKLTDKRREAKGVYVKKVEDARANRLKARELKNRLKRTHEDFELDIWGKDVPEAKRIPSTLVHEWISKEAQDLNVPKEARVKAPKVKVDRNQLPAVELPHPGVSYNPSLKDHQELLSLVVEKEKVLMKKEAHIERVTTKMFKKGRQDQKEAQWLEEMMVGLPEVPKPFADVAPPVESDGDASDDEYRAVNPPVKNKEKKLKKKKRQQELKEEKEKRKRGKIEKKKLSDIYKLRFLQSAIEKADERMAKLREIRVKQRAESRSVGTRRLNAHKMQPIEVEYTEPAELSGNLRNVAAKGNLLRDRYLSLQQRSILAPSKIYFKKKKSVKAFFKPGHKVTEKDIQKYTKAE